MSASSASRAPKSLTSPAVGYRKGAAVRQRIIDAALDSFCAHGFKGATTRQIAAAAGVHLPALKYYFGGKEGLYKACADEVVAYYRGHFDRVAQEARFALDPGLAPEDARAELKAWVRVLASFPGDRETFAPFIYREIGEPGPAFDILQRGIWEPGIDYVAQLIGRLQADAAGDATARIQAVLLIASLAAFRSGQPLALKLVGWTKMGDAELATMLAVLDAQIDAIGRA